METFLPYINTIVPIILSGIIAYISWLYRSEKEKRITIQGQLSDKKYNVYIKIIELFYGTFENTLKNKKHNPQEIEKKMIEIVKEITIYGSDDVMKKFSYWKANTGDSQHPTVALKNYLSIIIALRKDMGHPNTKVNYDDILGMIVADYAKEKKNLGL